MNYDYGGARDKKGSSGRKPMFSWQIVCIVALVGTTTFFAGLYISNMDSGHISGEDLDKAIANLELKMLQDRLPTGERGALAKISADDDPVIGDPNAPITIVEFSDFQCPFCARFHTQTLPMILSEYIDTGKVKLVFRDFPIERIHPNALMASVAAECANEQDKFKDMHDVLFDRQDEWSDKSTTEAMSIFGQYADQIGLNQDPFASCLDSAESVEEVRGDLEDGRTYGISGTPGFFVGNDQVGYVMVKGAQPFDTFKRIIDAHLSM